MSDYISPPSTLAPGSLVWAYVRDSGGIGQEQSTAQQEAEIMAYCKRYNLILVRLFSDVAKSGGSTGGRDQFNAMIDATKNEANRPAGLIIWNFARFSRDVDDSDYFKATLRRRDIVIHSLTDPIPEGPWSRVVEKIIDIANEEKRRQTSRDVKRSLSELVRKGYAPGGFPPQGYRAEKVVIGEKRDHTARVVSKWVPNRELWDLVKLAWQMRAEGRSYGDIQKATGGKLFRSVNCWPTFFRNKTYLGIGKFGNLEIPDHHEPAITWEVWEVVQKRAGIYPRGLNHPRRNAYPSLLAGLAFCLECGAAMNHHTSAPSDGWPYYICNKKDRQRHVENACQSRRINERRADKVVLETVLNRILSPVFLEELIEETREQMSDTAALDSKITQKQNELNGLERGIQRLLDLVETGDVETGDATTRLKQRQAERARLQSEIKILEAQRDNAKIEITPETVALILDTWRDQFTKVQEANDIRALRALLARFVVKVELGYKKGRIWYTYPVDGNNTQIQTPDMGAPYDSRL
ncbi:MAG: recombinase family protein [Anaerolineales bacterium]|jgi:DNA invertase Pin-like site-specific DNA recombinase